MSERSKPMSTALDVDLCDHWVVAADKRCANYWKQEIVLTRDIEVGGKTMSGTYPAGTWRFCNLHANIFTRDRQDRE